MELFYEHCHIDNAVKIEKKVYPHTPLITVIYEENKTFNDVYNEITNDKLTFAFIEDAKARVFTHKLGGFEYDIVDINNRLFLQNKRKMNFVKLVEFICQYWDFLLYGEDVSQENIEYYINRKYGQKYEHKNEYLPSKKQNLSDYWHISDKEILGDCTIESQEDTLFDFMMYFFGIDMDNEEEIREIETKIEVIFER